MPKRARNHSQPHEGSASKRQATSAQRDRQLMPPPSIARSSTRWPPALLANIREAAKRTPRFLFAYGHLNDPEDGYTTSLEAVVPDAFKNRLDTKDFTSIPLHEFGQSLQQQFSYDNFEKSLLSTWTASLFTATEAAIELTQKHPAEEVYLAVIDTRALRRNTFALHVDDLRHIGEGLAAHVKGSWSEDEFVAYGTIYGSCYKAIKLSTLQSNKNGYSPFEIVEHSNTNGSPSFEIDLARAFADTFGEVFALPVAAMAVSTLTRRPEIHAAWLDDNCVFKEGVIASFQDYDIPQDWARDPKIMTDIAASCSHLDALRGVSLLRALVKRSSGRFRGPKSRVDADGDVAMTDGLLRAGMIGPGFAMLGGTSFVSADSTSDFDPMSLSPEESEFGQDVEGPEDLEDSDDPITLPSGPMDDDTKRGLLRAQAYTPRYLFRGWNNTDHLSGGFQGLNTTEAITPLAYLQDESEGVESIYHLDRAQLKAMCMAHLGTQHTLKTQLSSWASSLQVAFNFARGMQANCFISIIDTKEIQDSNAIIHVPQLDFLLGMGSCYAHEYLAHGVIKGPAHKAVPLSAFMDMGLPRHYRYPTGIRAIEPVAWNEAEHQITPEELSGAVTVAQQYGPRFGAPVLIAVLCNKQRSPRFWRDGVPLKTLNLVERALKDFKIPQRLCADDTILKDIVYTAAYGDVEQMIRMLRAVVDHRHGKGARQRRKSGHWDDSASLMNESVAEEIAVGGKEAEGREDERD